MVNQTLHPAARLKLSVVELEGKSYPMMAAGVTPRHEYH